MVVKLVLPREIEARVTAVAPLARPTAVVRRLVELGLAAVEADPSRLNRSAANKETE